MRELNINLKGAPSAPPKETSRRYLINLITVEELHLPLVFS